MKHKLVMVIFLLCSSPLLYAQSSNTSKSNGAYPNITAEDLAACKKEIAELHRLEINHLKIKAHQYCTKPHKNDHPDNCKNANKWVTESSSISNLTWYMEGNTSCADGEYPCYGLAPYNAEEPNVDFIKTLASGVKNIDGGWTDYSYVVDKCVAKLWLAKRSKKTSTVIAGNKSDKKSAGNLTQENSENLTPSVPAQQEQYDATPSTKNEYTACRSVIMRSCFEPGKCDDSYKKGPCVRVKCDDLGGYDGGPVGWGTGSILSNDAYNGFRSQTWEESVKNPGEINICSRRQEVEQFVGQYGNVTEKTKLNSVNAPGDNQSSTSSASTTNNASSKKEKRHHVPDAEATKCLSLNTKPGFGGFVNSCAYSVEWTYCAYHPKEGAWADAFDCEKNQLGAGLVGANKTEGVHTKGAEKIHWVACRYSGPDGKPLGISPMDIKWDGQKKALTFRCGEWGSSGSNK